MAEDQDPAEEQDPPQKKGRKGGLVIALLGAAVAGGGGFYATYSGMFNLPMSAGAGGHFDLNYSFVSLDPMIVSLGPRASAESLRFSAQLEVEPEATPEVSALKPRITDVLQDFLRAVDEDELEDPAALGLLRAQMLRRIQTVVGAGKVRDLLIIEFILT